MYFFHCFDILASQIDGGGLTVSTDTQVDLLLEGVGLEGLGDTENGILEQASCASALVLYIIALNRISDAFHSKS